MVAAFKTASSKAAVFFILLALFFFCGRGDLLAGPSPPAVRSGGYRAVLSNGRVLQGTQVSGWGRVGSRPALAGVWLFDPANPVSWIRNEGISFVPRGGSYVEFAGGDRLPCKFIGYRSGLENPLTPQLSHLLVEPTFDAHKPRSVGTRQVRVLTRWLRRIVLAPHSRPPLSPGTIFFADGSSAGFRSLRWSRSGVRLLLESGITTVSFSKIAEIHPLPIDPWAAYFEQVGVLLPGLSGRLMRIETAGGVVLTASDERFREGQIGNPGNPRDWWHVFQPAWSLDALWLRYSSVKSRSYNRPDEVFLSSFLPVRVREKKMLGGGGRWLEDRSVLGSSLSSGGVESVRGFGVRAFCEMEFDLSDCVDAFQTGVGLDRRAAGGGCASARVLLREYPSLKETKLYQSEVLVGSARLLDSGRINLRSAARGGDARLVLLADPELEGTPAGADPLDVRDFIDWIEPRLSLDPARFRREVSRRTGMFISALRGWFRPPGSAAGLPLINLWDETNPRRPEFRPQLAVSPGGLRLRRRLEPSADSRYLGICARLLPGVSDTCQLRLLIDGVERTRFAIPVYTPPAPPPALPPAATGGLVFDLSPFMGSEIEIELQFLAPRESTPLELSCISFSPRRPGLRSLYDEEPSFSAGLTDGDGFARAEWRDSYSGSSSLLVSGGARESVMLDGMDIPIRRFPTFGEYRWLRFAWKKRGGTGISLQVAHDLLFGPEPGRRTPSFRYYQGHSKKGEEPFGGVFTHLHPNVPGQWVLHTVDLFTHFGEFNLTGLGFSCPDGEYALFDHIWLARTPSDFEGGRLSRTSPRNGKAWRGAMARRVEDADVVTAEEKRKVVGVVAPGFEMSGGSGLFGEGVNFFQSYRGRPGVLRTHPGSPVDAVALARKFAAGDAFPKRMRLSVGHDYRGDWRLQVLANGSPLVDMLIGSQVSADGWVDLDLDLSAFEGEALELQVLNMANDWSYEYAYWWLVSLEE